MRYPQRSWLIAPALVVMLLAVGFACVVGDDAEPDRTRAYLPMVARTYHTWYELDFGEPNDVPATAYGPLRLGETVQAYLWDETDLGDYYYFVPTTEVEIGVELTHIPAGCDYDLYVHYWHERGLVLVGWSNGYGSGDERVVFRPVPGRRYTVRVYPYRGHSYQEPYHLTVATR